MNRMLNTRATVLFPTVCTISCASLLAGANAFHPKPSKSSDMTAVVRSLTSGDIPVVGKAHAPVTVVGFFDYECPACRRRFGQVEKMIARHGDAALYVHQLPLPCHKLSKSAATLAIDAQSKGNFVAVNRALLAGDILTQKSLDGVAKEFGLNPKLTKTITDRLAKDWKGCQELKVSSVPMFVVSETFSTQLCRWDELPARLH